METTKEERDSWASVVMSGHVGRLCRDVDACVMALEALLAGVKWEGGTWAILDLETFEASLLKARAVLAESATPAATG